MFRFGVTARLIIVAAGIVYAVCHAAACAAEPPSAQSGAFVPDPAAVLREGPAYRYPQSGWVVLHIEGTPYERGYQHGKLLAAEIADFIQALANHRSPKAPVEAWRDMRMLVNALFLRRYEGEYLQEMKGIADGAAAVGAKFDGRFIDLVDVVALNSEIEVEFLQSGLDAAATGLEGQKFREPLFNQSTRDPEDEDDEHCSAFAAVAPATANGEIVFGHITMFKLYYVRHFNVWIDIKPSEGRRMLFQTYPGGIMSGLDYYLNDGGLLVAETTIRQTGFNVDGLALASRIRKVVQYADSIDKAVEILTNSNNGLYSNEWLFADVNTKEIAMFELGTHKTRLWRSSRNEWPGGMTGFYWGCNNAKDVEVRKETVASLADKPANLAFRPSDRDKAWLRLFAKRKGKIDVNFGFEAFTLPPLAAFPSCDAKFTTGELARQLKSWALFGPPLGRTWQPTDDERKRNPDIQALVPNDWALLSGAAPPADATPPVVVDVKPFQKPAHESKIDEQAAHIAAWHGTLLPKTDADTWLAAAFSDYEKIVALQNSLRHEAKGEKLSRVAQDRLDTAMFAPRSRWLTAVRRLGHDVPLAETRSDLTTNEWYDIAAGKGVLLLAALRGEIGVAAFDALMDEFGRAHAGQEVTTAAFRRHVAEKAGDNAAKVIDAWLDKPAAAATSGWSIYSFEQEPEQALIVYGTLGDRYAQREAATELQRKISRRFYNYAVGIVADDAINEADLKSHHLLLVGRPACHRIVAEFAHVFAVKFGSGSFRLRDETFAHADSAVIAVGQNPRNPRYSAVVYAGLGARATWKCVQELPDRGGAACEVLLLAAGQPARALCLPQVDVIVAKP